MKFALKTESKPASNAWKAKLLYDVSTPSFSGVRFYENVEVHTSEKSDLKLISKTSVDWNDEAMVGAHVEHDGKDFTKMQFQSVCSPADPAHNLPSDSTFWSRLDTKREFVTLGCDNPQLG